MDRCYSLRSVILGYRTPHLPENVLDWHLRWTSEGFWLPNILIPSFGKHSNRDALSCPLSLWGSGRDPVWWGLAKQCYEFLQPQWLIQGGYNPGLANQHNSILLVGFQTWDGQWPWLIQSEWILGLLQELQGKRSLVDLKLWWRESGVNKTHEMRAWLRMKWNKERQKLDSEYITGTSGWILFMDKYLSEANIIP